MKRDKEKKPILYEKYKREHHLEDDIFDDEVRQTLPHRKVSSFFLLLILIMMSALSIVGAVALWNPVTRMMLVELL